MWRDQLMTEQKVNHVHVACHHDIASTAVFSLDRPAAPRPPLPSADDLEVGGEPLEPPT